MAIALVAMTASGCRRHSDLACEDVVRLSPPAGKIASNTKFVVLEENQVRLGLDAPAHGGLELRDATGLVAAELTGYGDGQGTVAAAELAPRSSIAAGVEVWLQASRPRMTQNGLAELPASSRTWTSDGTVDSTAPTWTGSPRLEVLDCGWSTLLRSCTPAAMLELRARDERPGLRFRVRASGSDGTRQVRWVIPGVGSPARTWLRAACGATPHLRSGVHYRIELWAVDAAGNEAAAPGAIEVDGFEE